MMAQADDLVSIEYVSIFQRNCLITSLKCKQLFMNFCCLKIKLNPLELAIFNINIIFIVSIGFCPAHKTYGPL